MKGNRKILAIDDEFAALTKMKTLLSEYGQCEVATSGGQSIALVKYALAEGKYFDLITIDIELPDIDGITLLSQILKEEEKHDCHSVKIIVSAVSTTTNVCRAANNHCDGFLVKPVKRQMLHEKLSSLGFL
jgi:two-component system chemotaxis response regulator CheY